MFRMRSGATVCRPVPEHACLVVLLPASVVACARVRAKIRRELTASPTRIVHSTPTLPTTFHVAARGRPPPAALRLPSVRHILVGSRRFRATQHRAGALSGVRNASRLRRNLVRGVGSLGVWSESAFLPCQQFTRRGRDWLSGLRDSVLARPPRRQATPYPNAPTHARAEPAWRPPAPLLHVALASRPHASAPFCGVRRWRRQGRLLRLPRQQPRGWQTAGADSGSPHVRSCDELGSARSENEPVGFRVLRNGPLEAFEAEPRCALDAGWNRCQRGRAGHAPG